MGLPAPTFQSDPPSLPLLRSSLSWPPPSTPSPWSPPSSPESPLSPFRTLPRSLRPRLLTLLPLRLLRLLLLTGRGVMPMTRLLLLLLPPSLLCPTLTLLDLLPELPSTTPDSQL